MQQEEEEEEPGVVDEQGARITRRVQKGPGSHAGAATSWGVTLQPACHFTTTIIFLVDIANTIFIITLKYGNEIRSHENKDEKQAWGH